MKIREGKLELVKLLMHGLYFLPPVIWAQMTLNLLLYSLFLLLIENMELLLESSWGRGHLEDIGIDEGMILKENRGIINENLHRI
jgi:hypothetical protein